MAAAALPLSDAEHSELARLRELIRPTALTITQGRDVIEPLQPLLPMGLPRGGTVVVEGSLALAIALAAAPSSAGSWICLVGLGAIGAAVGLAAVRELGVGLERLAVVDVAIDGDADGWVNAVAASMDAVDVVVARPPRLVTARDARRLAGRLRERGSTLVLHGRDRAHTITADRVLRVQQSRWEGIGHGHGYLRSRCLTIEATGRAGAAQPRRASVMLPDSDGGISPVTTVTNLFAASGHGAAGFEATPSSDLTSGDWSHRAEVVGAQPSRHR
jgi:hypothetical protein